MMTLDTLARMADRMSSELDRGGSRPPYRRADAELMVRQVSLPPLAEERRRAGAIFLFVVGVAVAVFTVTGVLVTQGAALAEGTVGLDVLLRTALAFALGTAAIVIPFAGLGVWRELSRYRRVRAAFGPTAWLDREGRLRSEDGARVLSLRDPSSALSASRRG